MHCDSIQSWGDDRGGGASHAGGHARAARPAPQRGRRAGVRRRWGDGAVQLRRGRRWSAQPRRGDAARDGLHRAPGRPGAGHHRGVRVDAAGPDAPRGLGRADAPAWATERAAGRGSESGPFLAGGGADRRSDRGPPGRARHDGGPGAGWGRAAGLGGGRRTDHPGGPGVARAGAARAGADRAGRDRAGADRAGAAGAEGIFATLTGGPARRYDDLAVLTTATLGFALGVDTVEGTKHLRRTEAGAAVGLAMVPQLATLRARLSALADTSDPLALQRAVAAAMLSADPAADPVYFVDDHFVPYSGARPVGKGWNTKRRHAQPGRADTLLTDARGRAVVFGSGEPSGLTSTLPGVLTG